MRFILLIVVCMLALSIHAADPEKRPPRLTNTAAFPPQYRGAVVAVADYVGSPEDFFAKIEPQKGGRELWFHLWHKSAFLPEIATWLETLAESVATSYMTHKAGGHSHLVVTVSRAA